MPKSYDDLCAQADRVHGFVSLVQVDVMDGVFVPSVSWPYDAGRGAPLAEIFAHDELPHRESLDYEFDLMVKRPDRDIDAWLSLGASRLLFHYESLPDIGSLLSLIPPDTRETVEIGVAIGPHSDPEALEDIAHEIDCIQVMGIEKIGYQGQAFVPETIALVARLRDMYPHLTLCVDGSVNTETLRPLAEAGATRLTVGSALFAHDDIEKAFFELQAIVDDFEKESL